MKNLGLLFLCCIFACNLSYAQKGNITYSPRIYKEMKQHFYSSAVQKSITTKHENRKQQQIIELEYLKFMALSPQSKLRKAEAICQCLVDKKMLTQSELKLVTSLFAAFVASNEKDAIKITTQVRSLSTKSIIMESIVKALRPTKDSGYTSQSGDNVDMAADGILAVSIIAGALVGGPVGAELGAASGKVSGGMLKKLHGWLFGKGKGFMPGPDGEACQPPYLGF